MPFTIDATSETQPSRHSLFVPSPTDRGFAWSLVATVKAHFATRRMLRRLRQAEGATVHLCQYLRADIGLPPSPPAPRSHWEIRT